MTGSVDVFTTHCAVAYLRNTKITGNKENCLCMLNEAGLR